MELQTSQNIVVIAPQGNDFYIYLGFSVMFFIPDIIFVCTLCTSIMLPEHDLRLSLFQNF
jgi:hypothetical protein